MTHLYTYWLHYLFLAAAVLFVVLYIKRGSLPGVFLGGRIRDTIGETKGSDVWGFHTSVRVHTLESPDPNRAVAVEICTKTINSMRWTPVTLTTSDARLLSQLLADAADKSSNNSFKPKPLRGAA
jgi:hypothetical protein